MDIEKFLNEKERVMKLSELLENKYDLKKLYIQESEDYICLTNIVVNKKNQGTGTSVLKELIEYADKYNKKLRLTPEKNKNKGATSVNRLIKFYKKFGFVENKGSNKDYEIHETMYRLPVEKPKPKIKP